MLAATLLLLSVFRLDLVKGQQDEYYYPNGQLLEDDKEDEGLLKDYIPVQSSQEQRFLEGLVIEAGMHTLFPEWYVPKEPKEGGKLKVYEMKGQPEIEESYMNERARRGDMNCPQHCSVYKPVCGSDGKVYESECQMRKENCGRSDVAAGPWQRCRGRHYLCPSRCLDFNDPVCGSDGRIYHNICVMRKRNCGKLIDVLPVRKCYENVKQSKEMTDCPEDCQEVYKPVCGSDGVIYYNQCFMKKRTCNGNLMFCKKCQEVYKPVCGSDGVIYYNQCFMKKRTCKSGIVEVDMEGCAYVPKCPEICLPIYDPVCGADGKLYINQCRMLQENCGKEIKVMARSYCGYIGKEISSPTTQVKVQVNE